MNLNRRPATAADITVGATVYKGQGKVAYRVTGSKGSLRSDVALYVGVVKTTSQQPKRVICDQPITMLTVEA